MLMNRRRMLAGLTVVGASAVTWWQRQSVPKVPNGVVSHQFDAPLAAPKKPLNVYHLGHSLVGRDMPAMLAQLARHSYDSQLGWGSSLRDHWEPDVPINGFEHENNHPRFRPAREALETGAYDALILTEMVEIRDAIKYHASADYLVRWAQLARQANADARIYLYETWHHTDDGAGWLTRVDQDLRTYWQEQVANLAIKELDVPIYLIPAGQVMAAVVRELSPNNTPEMLFALNEDGSRDTIHTNDLGAYVVALTHYVVLYHRSSEGLPHALTRADGTPVKLPDQPVIERVQEIVWNVVTRHPETGVPA